MSPTFSLEIEIKMSFMDNAGLVNLFGLIS